MIYSNEEVTSEALMNRYLGIGEKVKNIIEVIKEDNNRTKKFVSDGTYRKYIALLNHVEESVIFQYKASDLNNQLQITATQCVVFKTLFYTNFV